ncbi:protein TIC 62, chloroplastic [Ipomoea triloba]|uniref:protein TIC 62, chloroplastic n=1 Tax=Ipomoea triloba TaxID=35885 RepID=UPI00125E67DD|nr:protein TIC 62, chloroplastic [Ipomoea triloba]
MELYSLQSIAVTKIPRRSFAEKPFLCGQTVKPLPCNTVKRCPDSRKLKFLDFRAQASGTTKFSSVAPESKDVNLKDGNVVFVAGATGRVGSRTVRELLKLGFQVRAGVRSIQRAEPLVKSVKQMKLDNVADGGTSPIERLEIVECDLEKSKIVPALGNASTVICCIGASEKEVFDITGPYRIDYQATKNLIDAATTAKVGHFILLTSLGTNKFGFPAAILNLFWGVLCWKRRAEEALLASGLPYTIVRPGGMERPTDTYKETHNITLSQEDTLFGGQVSNLQVAELMAFMVKNPTVSYYKVVEVIAETTAPLTPLGDLLTRIPSKKKVSPAKDPGSATQPAVSAVTIPKITSTPTEKESTPTISIEAKPLSPYTAYADLKPPTSPTPSPPSIVDKVSFPAEASKTTETIDPNLAKVEVQKTTPLSPYTAYEDLKPPTSPIPTQSRSKAASTTAEAQVQLNVPTNGPPTVSASRHSPYLVYDDLKPPTSPTPSTPTVSQIKTAQSPAAAKPEGTLHVNASKERPLSPYTAYEDLKPPTSPSPSSPKL